MIKLFVIILSFLCMACHDCSKIESDASFIQVVDLGPEGGYYYSFNPSIKSNEILMIVWIRNERFPNKNQLSGVEFFSKKELNQNPFKFRVDLKMDDDGYFESRTITFEKMEDSFESENISIDSGDETILSRKDVDSLSLITADFFRRRFKILPKSDSLQRCEFIKAQIDGERVVEYLIGGYILKR